MAASLFLTSKRLHSREEWPAVRLAQQEQTWCVPFRSSPRPARGGAPFSRKIERDTKVMLCAPIRQFLVAPPYIATSFSPMPSKPSPWRNMPIFTTRVRCLWQSSTHMRIVRPRQGCMPACWGGREQGTSHPPRFRGPHVGMRLSTPESIDIGVKRVFPRVSASQPRPIQGRGRPCEVRRPLFFARLAPLSKSGGAF